MNDHIDKNVDRYILKEYNKTNYHAMITHKENTIKQYCQCC